MNRATSLALVAVFCASAVSAQAASPKGKVGTHKPVGVMTGASGGFNFGNVTNPIVNTPPKAAPGFPYNPTGLRGGGHGPVVLNPPKPGPINGLPVPYKPQPICGSHHGCHHDYCRDWKWYISTSCGDDCGSCYLDGCGYSIDDDMCDDMGM
jgi:hypothetical protein